MTDDIFYRSAEELVRNYRNRTLSPIEVVSAILQRIDAVNPKINAVYFVDAEAALAAARAAEERWHRGDPKGLLDGVPVTLKDSTSAVGHTVIPRQSGK